MKGKLNGRFPTMKQDLINHWAAILTNPESIYRGTFSIKYSPEEINSYCVKKLIQIRKPIIFMTKEEIRLRLEKSLSYFNQEKVEVLKAEYNSDFIECYHRHCEILDQEIRKIKSELNTL